MASTKAWEGRRLLHLNITLTLMLSATLKGWFSVEKAGVLLQNDMTGLPV